MIRFVWPGVNYLRISELVPLNPDIMKSKLYS